jgi:hypothetical protein
MPAETASCACLTTVCATCCARATTPAPPPFDERLLVERLLLRPALFREEDFRLPPERLDADLLEDFRLPPRDEPRDEERDDDLPRFRADRPRFAPPDFRDDPPLPDFLRDLRLVAAIPVSPDGRSRPRFVARIGRD